jgi:glucoside 3-dehydrogenase (cytochrome c) hitch-hiker subunit
MDRRTSLAAFGTLAAHALFPRVLDTWAVTLDAQAATGAWQPRTLSPAAGAQVAALADAIIPDTDTPGARAAGVHVFIDLLLADCMTAEDRTAFVDGLAAFDASCRQAHGAGIEGATPAQRTALLVRAEGEKNAFVQSLKSLTVLGYGSSKIGASQALAWVAVPGGYRGCIDLAPGQRTWVQR